MAQPDIMQFTMMERSTQPFVSHIHVCASPGIVHPEFKAIMYISPCEEGPFIMESMCKRRRLLLSKLEWGASQKPCVQLYKEACGLATPPRYPQAKTVLQGHALHNRFQKQLACIEAKFLTASTSTTSQATETVATRR